MSRFSIRDSSPVIVESMLPERSGNLALRFRIRVDVNAFSVSARELIDKDDPRRDELLRGLIKCYEFIVTRPSNYTTVFKRETPFGSFDDKEYPWKQVAHHDSCWKEPFEVWRNAASMESEYTDRGIASDEVYTDISYSIFTGGYPHYVELVGKTPIMPEGEPTPRIISTHDARDYSWHLHTKNVPIHRTHLYMEEGRKERRERYMYSPVPIIAEEQTASG